MTCKICNKNLTGRQKLFCSIRCRNVQNGRNKGGWNNQRVKCVCEECGKEYEVPPCRMKGKQKTRHCSIICHCRAISRETDRSMGKNPSWKGGIQIYRKYKKECCENCKSKKNLEVHHIDSNRYNNEEENLITLCKKCHQTLDGRINNRDELERFTSSAYVQLPPK